LGRFLIFIDQRYKRPVTVAWQHHLTEETEASLQGMQAQPQGSVSNLHPGIGYLRVGIPLCSLTCAGK